MSIRVQIKTFRGDIPAADILVVPVVIGKNKNDVVMPPLVPASLRTGIRSALHARDYKALWGSTEMFYVSLSNAPLFIAVVCSGQRKQPAFRHWEGLRRSVAQVVDVASRHALHTVAIITPPTKPAESAAAMFEGIELAYYRFVHHKRSLLKEQQIRGLRELTFYVPEKTQNDVQSALGRARHVLESVVVTRELVNQPASHMAPRVLVKHARAIARKESRISVKILNRANARKEGFAGFLAVAQGSDEEPYVIHLTYRPSGKARKKIVLVGKGITFDSGGLSLKPAQAMESMKIDMAGAATVLGIFSALARLTIPVEVHGVIASCENMPSGKAYRPGDVIVSRNGKTIEVLNTDAEGRITLADALSYAVDLKPDAIIDLATLTGACIVALGDTYAGLWSTSEVLQHSLLDAAREEGEGLVPFPLPEEYLQTIESKVADLRNIATVYGGGAITAALFLREFVNDIPWAHLDIAGPSFAERMLLPYYQYGGTGFGVRTLLRFLNSVASIKGL